MNSWRPAAVIVFGYIAAAFWQSKRTDDLTKWMKAEFGRVAVEFKQVSEKLDKLDGRFQGARGRTCDRLS